MDFEEHDTVIGVCSYGTFRGSILKIEDGAVIVRIIEMLTPVRIAGRMLPRDRLRIPMKDIRENMTLKYRFTKERKCHEAVDELKEL